ncbi:MAG: hypothetical protein ACU0CO_13045 [Shimia sp.]
MRALLLLACAAALGGCAGTPTGKRSPCFGVEPSSGTALAFVSTRGSGETAPTPADCDFQRF